MKRTIAAALVLLALPGLGRGQSDPLAARSKGPPGALRGRAGRRGGGPLGRGARGGLRRHQHPDVLYGRGTARRGAADRGVSRRVGLDLPQQDGPPPPDPVMGDRPSFIYRLSVRLAERALPLAARFDKKIARGLDARRGVLERLAAWGQAQRDPRRPLVWVHAPSVGEGLQAKPVLESLRGG